MLKPIGKLTRKSIRYSMGMALLLICIYMLCLSLLFVGCSQGNDISSNKDANTASNNTDGNSPDDEADEPDMSEDEHQPGDSLKEPSDSDSPAEDNQNDSQEPVIFDEDQLPLITRSEKIEGWNRLIARMPVYSLEITEEGMSWVGMEDERHAVFLIDFPADWEFNGYSVFSDAQEHKLAEIVPLSEANITPAALFDRYQPSAVAEEEVISKDLFEVNGYKGLKVVSKTSVEYGEQPSWYVHAYYLSNDTYIFSMMFYTYEINETSQQLFEDIIGTFSFISE